jgi:hypothetical protein
VKYHKILPTIVEELSRNIIEQEVNSYNFNDMEMEIEGIQQLVESNIDYNHDVASEYNKMLR